MWFSACRAWNYLRSYTLQQPAPACPLRFARIDRSRVSSSRHDLDLTRVGFHQVIRWSSPSRFKKITFPGSARKAEWVAGLEIRRSIPGGALALRSKSVECDHQVAHSQGPVASSVFRRCEQFTLLGLVRKELREALLSICEDASQIALYKK